MKTAGSEKAETPLFISVDDSEIKEMTKLELSWALGAAAAPLHPTETKPIGAAVIGRASVVITHKLGQ